MVKLEEVARLAGVSASTVSRILNGTAVVSDAKKQAVDDAIARLGFVPNPVARGLAGGKTLSVGVVTQSIDSPFYGVALHGIEEVPYQVKLAVLAKSTPEPLRTHLTVNASRYKTFGDMKEAIKD